MVISICVDCVVMDANGWDAVLIGRPLPTPAPLSLIPTKSYLCAANDREHFSWDRCDGCGSALGGARFDYIIKEATK